MFEVHLQPPVIARKLVMIMCGQNIKLNIWFYC